MKKYWKSLMFALAGVFALSSCEDVPAPYTIPGTEPTPTTSTLASTDFKQGQGNWTLIEDPSLSGVWKNNSQYGMVASGFKSSKANAATSWLVSPEVDLTQTKGAKAVVREAINKIDGGSVEEMMTVWASTDDGANWAPLKANTRPGGTSWNFQDDEFDLGEYDGQKIKLGFKYISTDQYAGTWEIESVTIKGEGSATIDGESAQPNTPKGEPKGSGTAEDPYNVAAVDSFTSAGSYTNKEPSAEVYVKGIVSEIGDLNTQYSELNYYISDDGTKTNQFYVYNGYGLNGEKITSQDYLKVGDVVVIKGKVVTHNGINEFTYGSQIVSLNGKTEGDGNNPQPTGENLLTNGDFESWTGGLPDNWKSASTAGNATLSQSEDAHGGLYSVAVGANATSNKRMAYKEITLKAGTYTFAIFAKSTTEEKSQTQVGYVTVNNGTADSQGYKYGGYVSLSNTEWTEASTTFTLNEQKTVCLVVMNPKTSNYATAQTILVDDATLVTSDGGIADGDDSGDDQSNVDVQHITVAEFLAKADTEKTYELTGTVQNIKNTTYGNFDLVEGDASIYVYGLLDLEGKTKNFASLGIAEGDKITVTGQYSLYNGQPQIKNAQFIRKEN